MTLEQKRSFFVVLTIAGCMAIEATKDLMQGNLSASIIVAEQTPLVHPVAPLLAEFDKMPGNADVDKPLGWISISFEGEDWEEQEKVFDRVVQAKSKQDYKSALKFAKQFAERWPDNEGIGNLISTVYNDMGVRSIDEQDYREALAQTRKALEYAPGNAPSYLNMGFIFLQTGRYSSSLQAYRRGLREVGNHPDTWTAWTNLGDAAIRLNELELAENAYKHALTHKPKDDLLRERMKTVKSDKRMDRRSETIKMDHFVISYRRGLSDETINISRDALEQAYSELAPIFRVGTSEPLTIVLYRVRDYKRHVDAPDWAGGFFDGKVRVPVDEENLEQFVETLRHEVVHGYVRKRMEGVAVPAWLNEGLAQYYEPRRIQKTHHKPFFDELKKNRYIPLSKLDESFIYEQDEDRVDLMYAQSLAIVQYIMSEKAPEVTDRMLESYRRGMTTAQVLSHELSMSESELLERVREYYVPTEKRSAPPKIGATSQAGATKESNSTPKPRYR